MRFQPGQSGNPRGRPPKSRALTEILKRAGGRGVTDADGKRRSSRRVMARCLWELAATGRTTLAGEPPLALQVDGPGDWFRIVQWLYEHIDGKPVAAMDVTSGGRPIEIVEITLNQAGDEP